MKILAVDPGGTTGIAIKDFTESILEPPITQMPEGFGNSAAWIHGQMINGGGPDLVVVEKFTIGPQTARKDTKGSNTAIELIGVTRYLALKHEIPLEEQKPADAKNFCTDAKLRRLGWYVPGPDHARDAIRHLLLAAVRHKVVNLSALLPVA